ncbi:hypothetical protein [Zunongwangia pacifica]|uniref:Uncharacterized protein n=1 Tax=Zunongwangia pacifica TaxID=2911062 RepID=A0A9X2CQW8_9FLAO|nr:hypothetical protein [Zunongwangia pacifica]MCL6220427.1 hypothetical protein [Zunongwangia pacifica]
MNKIKLLWNKFCDIFGIMSREKKNISKRALSFRHSDSSLTSERVGVIISNRKDSVNLAEAVRSLRHNVKASFKVSDSTKGKINRLEKA